MKEKTIYIDGNTLTLLDIESVAFHGARVKIKPRAYKKIKKSRAFIEKIVSGHETVYGINTGVGSFSNKKIKPTELAKLQKNIVRSHCTGVGRMLHQQTTRAMMLLRANVLAKGNSGVRTETIEKLIEILNKNLHPVIYEQGSVGASGDLAPLAELALCLIGEGYFIYKDKIRKAGEVFKKENIEPLTLYAKEGISLINGTQLMTAVGALALIRAQRILKIADIVGAMTLEAVKGSHKAFDADIMKVRPHPGAIASAKNLRTLLTHSYIRKSHEGCSKVQDAYSLRCMPQVHGAVRDVVAFAGKTLAIEFNAAVDNPLIFPEKNKVLSCGNFHGQPVAYAMDSMGIALTGLSNISERRIEKLMNPIYSGLPPFLAKHGGLESGLMMVQVAAASLASENKVHAAPASVDTIPTSMDKEDHVSMGSIAALKTEKIMSNIEKVLAMEILCAFFALDHLYPLKPAEPLFRLYAFLKNFIPPLTDRPFNKDLALIDERIRDNSILTTVEKVTGRLL